MSKTDWEVLSEFLRDEGLSQADKDIIDKWKADVQLTTDCPVCGAGLTEAGGGFICRGTERHEIEPHEVETETSNLDVEEVLPDICRTAGFSVDSSVKTGDLPASACIQTSAGARITLVCDEEYQSKTLTRVFGDSIENHRVNAVFIPGDLRGTVWDQVSKYPIGSLAPVFPLTLLDVPDVVSDVINQGMDSRERSKMALEMQGMDSGLLASLNQNPRLIEGDLGYTRIFRENGNGKRLGNRLEEVCKAAFMTLDMSLQHEFGGTSGKNITDIAAKLPSAESFSPSDPLLALVDTKSGSNPNLSDEQIVQKHAEYLRQANAKSFEGWHVAHMFVVYQMGGKSANELDWYDAIQEAMQPTDHYSGDTTMVVLFAGALSHLIDAHLSISQRNQLNLSIENLRDSLHALFNWREFRKRVPGDIREMTRVDRENKGGLSKADKRYKKGYNQREQLLVITPEMVDSYLQEIMTNDEYDIVEADLSKYPSKW